MVGATEFEPATTCTPSGVTARAEGGEDSQALGNIRDGDPARSSASPNFAERRGKFAAGLLLALGGPDCLLTVADVASMLRLSKSSVYKLVADGKLAHVRIGNAIRFIPSQIRVIRTHS